MSAPKFMHGPWHFAGSGIIANDDDEEIGLSAVYGDDPNGKLIIAAPDMYEALQKIAAHLADACDGGVLDRKPEARLWELALAVLAKADGHD